MRLGICFSWAWVWWCCWTCQFVRLLLVEGALGATLAWLFPRWSLWKLSLYHLAVCVAGLLTLYLVEFGEVSNERFTVGNVAAQILLLVGTAVLGSWLLRRYVKQPA